jgi:hypothetical protein
MLRTTAGVNVEPSVRGFSPRLPAGSPRRSLVAGFAGLLAAAVCTSGSAAGYAAGETGPAGGIMFPVNQGGFTSNGITCRSLKAAPADISGTVRRASDATIPSGEAYGGAGSAWLSIPGAAGTAIGTGAADTAAIPAPGSGAPPFNAAKIIHPQSGPSGLLSLSTSSPFARLRRAQKLRAVKNRARKPAVQ